jgi:hypothetical protein
MASCGFSRHLVDPDGNRFRLPLAEYNCESDGDKYAVLEEAKAAAERVGKRYSVLVTKSAGRTWHGLDQA